MEKKDYLQVKYEQINKLKNSLLMYEDVFLEEVMKCLEKEFKSITQYLEDETKKISEKKEDIKKDENNGLKEFTIKELKEYDGKNGKHPYVAIDGVVYDLFKIKKWKNGMHHGMIAGQDLTEEFKKSHKRRLDIIRKAPIVGLLRGVQKGSSRIIENDDERKELREFTIKEVAEFDGKNGRQAYVVIRGTVYDLTTVKQWIEGKHYGVVAGNDLTEFFNTCHRGEEEILERLRIIGTLKNE